MDTAQQVALAQSAAATLPAATSSIG